MEIGGIDAQQTVAQLMQVERRPLVALQDRSRSARAAVDAIGKMRNNVELFRSAAGKLADTTTFSRFSVATTDDKVATATASGSASQGALTFTVDRLAQSHGLRSLGTAVSDTANVTSASVISVASGTRTLGIDTVRAGAGLGVGTSTLKVTQATAAASATGGVLGATTTIAAGANTVDVEVNGVARTLTIAAGSYDQAQLAAAVQTAIDAGGGGLSATTIAAGGNGALRLATTREGSTATLQITGGSALTSLGLSVDATARTGTDGVIDIGGTLTTVDRAEAGRAVAVATGSGTLDVTLAGGLRTGESKVATVSTGTRSLTDVARAITNANAGLSAAAVRVGDTAWRLQLSSRTPGAAGSVAIDGGALDGIGGLVESSAAQNARITIGSGAGAYQVESSSNTFSNVLSGVSIAVASTSNDPVTINVARNDESVANDVAAMVTAANTLLNDIKTQTRFDVATRTGGPLFNNSAIRRIADQVRETVTGTVPGLTGTTTNGIASSVGLSVNRDGTIAFDRAKFTKAIAEDSTAVTRLFVRGATGPADVAFATASGSTAAGSYAIDVTTAATQATGATLFSGGATATRLGVRVGTTTATVDVSAGQPVGQVVDSLNDAFGRSRLGLVAETDGTGLRVRAAAWGSAGNFEVNGDVLGSGSWDSVSGADVQGTINGAAATGSGRRLRLSGPAGNPAVGLSVDVAGGASGALGTIDYQPGVAARIVELATKLTGGTSGSLVTARQAADRRVETIADQMKRVEDRLAIRERNLFRQYSNLSSTLADLQTQGSWISSQLSSLPR
jgi:flagellar hook-associated protein 2